MKRTTFQVIFLFGQRLNIPYLYQIALAPGDDYLDAGDRVMPASKFLEALP